MAENVSEIKNQFTGLDMASLIGGPLKAVCDAQAMLAISTANFITDVCMDKAEDGNPTTLKTTKFSFNRLVTSKTTGKLETEKVDMDVPILSIVNVPSLCIDDVRITFDMEVKETTSSESKSTKEGKLDADAHLKIGPFKMNVKIAGAIACHESNTRSTDNSAKYHVEVHAGNTAIPEGLSRMLDILASAISPQNPEVAQQE